MWRKNEYKNNNNYFSVTCNRYSCDAFSSTAIVKPALASSNNNKDNNGNSVSKSDIRDVGKFLKCIVDNGGNDISKKKAQKCVDNYLG